MRWTNLFMPLERGKKPRRRRHSSFDLGQSKPKRKSAARVRRSSVGKQKKDKDNDEPVIHNRVLEALTLFKTMDLDEDGVISQDDFMQTFSNMSEGALDTEKIRSLFQTMCQENQTITRGAFIDNLHLFYEDPPSDSDDDNDNIALEKHSRISSIGSRSSGLLTTGRLWAINNLCNDSSQGGSENQPQKYSHLHSKKLASSFFQLLDVGNNGAINLDDFKRAWLDIDPTGQEEAFETLFHEMDRLNTGVITEEEFVDYFSLLSGPTRRKMSAVLDSAFEPSSAEDGEAMEDLFPSSDNLTPDRESFTHSNSVDLNETLRRKDADVQRLERELQRAKRVYEKAARKFEVVEREVSHHVTEKAKLQNSSEKLRENAKRAQEEAKKATEKAESYQSLYNSLKDKVAKLDNQLKVAKQNQTQIKNTLKTKDKALERTKREHQALVGKQKKNKSKREVAKKQNN